MRNKTNRSTRNKGREAESSVLDRLAKTRSGRRVPLNTTERETLLEMFASKSDRSIEIKELAPPGSFLAHVLRHFRDTDISYAVPLMSTITHMASLLTQRGVGLVLPNGARIRPTIWAIGLAESGSSKTLAFDELHAILVERSGVALRMLPKAATDAQWLLDLAESNGAFWFQDEVGQYLHAVESSKLHARMKPWLLEAYSGATISNRLKGEETKLEVRDPHFTFLGLTVRSTWSSDVDVRNMANGLCQRFSFFIAEIRHDKDVYDHFRFWATDRDERRRAELAATWAALAAQPAAHHDLRLPSEVLAWLEDIWWRGLRKTFGTTPLPPSYVRRVGHAIMQYLPVLHVLLGKAHQPIDLETALLASRFGEWHMASVLAVLQGYSAETASGVRLVATRYDQLRSAGIAPTPREIMRKLSKAQRNRMDTATVAEIVRTLDDLAPLPGLIEVTMDARTRSAALIEERDIEAVRLRLNERKRNERRLREVIERHQGTRVRPSAGEGEAEVDDADAVVLPFPLLATRPASAA